MYCIKKVTSDLTWVGANDRRLAMFEGVYSVPDGVSYNAYLLLDEKTVLFNTVDKAVHERFLENITATLQGRELDYLVVQHVEPDHSMAICELMARYPGMQLVCNKKTLELIKQFYCADTDSRVLIVTESDILSTGKHSFHFVMAPMVHWPEVMVVYDSTDKTLFSADAFGCFGALNGALFADEVDFAKDYLDEARRYYANIVGKYGTQVESLLEKIAVFEVGIICPLHGFIWRKDIGDFISKYILWSSYTPEEYGVMIAYASVYGNTENAAELLACRLRDKGIKTAMYDVSVSHASDIVSAAFKWSHLVFASTTYNAGIFVTMETVISDLTAHNIQNRTIAIIENGSWAPTSGALIRERLQACKNVNILEKTISLRSSLKPGQLGELEAMADAIAATLPAPPPVVIEQGRRETQDPAALPDTVDMTTLFKLTYGLFVLTAKDGDKDNGCITNTAIQIAEKPLRISIAVNKANYTCEMILKTGEFNISILSESAPFSVFQQFGFQSGRSADKFSGCSYDERTANGIRYLPENTTGVISGKVKDSYDYGTHILFIADVTQAFVLSAERSVTYQYYFDHIKPKPQAPKEKKSGYVCRICGYVYEGDELPDDFVCPLCKHGADDFEKL